MQNKLKVLWDSGRPVLNGWLSIGSPYAAEMMAEQGYDSLTIDIQHGAAELGTVLSMFQAMRASGVVPMARIPWLDPSVIMKTLDLGAMGVICPMINTAEQAAQFVNYTMFPPTGERSFGPTRAGIGEKEYYRHANQEVLALAMIETAQGFQNLDAIVATPGLSGIYVGPGDLTLSTQKGRLPPNLDPEDDELISMIRQIAETCNKNGLKACLHCATPEYAAMAIEWGFSLTTVASDLRFMVAGAAESVNKWRELTK